MSRGEVPTIFSSLLVFSFSTFGPLVSVATLFLVIFVARSVLSIIPSCHLRWVFCSFSIVGWSTIIRDLKTQKINCRNRSKHLSR